MNFSQILTELLVQTKQSQADLARFVGVKPNTVSDWINKGTSPKIEHLYRIADFFSVSFDYLFKGEEISTNNNIYARDLNNSKIVGGHDNSVSKNITYGTPEDLTKFALSENDEELLKIFRSLPTRERIKLLGIVYDFEEQYRKSNT